MGGTLLDRLAGRRRVHLDSVVLIYFIEQNPRYETVVQPLMNAVDSGRLVAISSVVTLIEVMVQPLRLGNRSLALTYRDYLLGSRNFEVYPVDTGVAEETAAIRARNHTLRTPDAIQIATALRQRAEVFITNDKDLRGVADIDVLVLDDYLAGASN
jgi:predicted nucleic acid-binding protein